MLPVGAMPRLPANAAAKSLRMSACRLVATMVSSDAGRLIMRAVEARQDACRAHVGVLVEALADLQTQAPQRDVVGDVRVAGRAEQDRVLVANRVKAVLRHHDAVLAVVVTAPIEILELEAECVA